MKNVPDDSDDRNPHEFTSEVHQAPWVTGHTLDDWILEEERTGLLSDDHAPSPPLPSCPLGHR